MKLRYSFPILSDRTQPRLPFPIEAASSPRSSLRHHLPHISERLLDRYYRFKSPSQPIWAPPQAQEHQRVAADPAVVGRVDGCEPAVVGVDGRETEYRGRGVLRGSALAPAP
jgi:hypothetical protein